MSGCGLSEAERLDVELAGGARFSAVGELGSSTSLVWILVKLQCRRRETTESALQVLRDCQRHVLAPWFGDDLHTDGQVTRCFADSYDRDRPASEIERCAVSRESLMVIGTPCNGPSCRAFCQLVLRALRGRDRALGVELNNGIERAVQRVDALQASLDHLHGRQRLIANGAGDLSRRCLRDAVVALRFTYRRRK